MNKQNFNNVQNMIECELFKNSKNIPELCYRYNCTRDEYHEFLELALLGYKEKYNQHNHPEHNRNY